MSKTALDYALGFDEKENDWGRGGKQLIYFNGKFVVYLDNLDKVRDYRNQCGICTSRSTSKSAARGANVTRLK